VRSAIAALSLAAFVSASLFGCKGSDEDVVKARAAASGAPVAASAAPVDHLAPGELVEGKEVAYGVALPRDADRIKTVAPSVYGHVRAAPSAVQAYFQARVSGGKVTRDPLGSSITIDQAHAADPNVALYIRIDHDPDGARFEVRDATPPPPELHANDEERWRANGLKPNGAIDPTTLH
jgi:hypothetical protein